MDCPEIEPDFLGQGANLQSPKRAVKYYYHVDYEEYSLVISDYVQFGTDASQKPADCVVIG